MISVVLLRSARRGGGRGRRWDGSEIRDDGFDLGRLEVILEAWHARRAVADDVAHHGVLSARGVARQLRPVERARHLRLGVADAARLVEQPHAEKLLIVERPLAGCLLGRRALQHHGERERSRPGTPSHRAPPEISAFFEAYDRAGAKGSVTVSPKARSVTTWRIPVMRRRRAGR